MKPMVKPTPAPIMAPILKKGQYMNRNNSKNHSYFTGIKKGLLNLEAIGSYFGRTLAPYRNLLLSLLKLRHSVEL